MNALKKLKLEMNGLEKNIIKYDKTSNAANIIPILNHSITVGDKESIIYCLDIVINWYKDNFQMICLKNKKSIYEEHYRLYQLIKDIRDELKISDESIFTESIGLINDNPLIFISHRSSDKKYGNALEKFITGLGVKNDQLIYTSHPMHKIPLNKNIYEYLRLNINRNIFMIILWSDEYLDSPACLNEMGAAWLVQCDYTNIYVPNFSFGNPKYNQCAVDTQRMGAILNGDEHCRQNMLELKNKIQEIFNLEIDEAKTIYLIDSFITEINNIIKKGNEEYANR